MCPRVRSFVPLGLCLPLLLAAAPAASAPAKSAVQAGASTPKPVLTAADAVSVKMAIAAPGAKAVLVNIWASWCGPCREEFPDVLRLRNDLKSQGLRVILVSADFDDARKDAVEFLKEMGVDFPSFIKVGKDEEFMNGLAKEWTGVLPATLVYDGAGTLRDLREGKQSYETFRGRVEKVLQDGSARPGS
jgi:thiol-disulfide isomerase/thioredoxin